MIEVQPSPGIVVTASGRRATSLLKWRDLAPTSRVMVVATTVSMVAFLDVTVVRGLLLPAIMTLLGRVNWWSPTWTRRPTAALRPAPHTQ